MKKILVLIVCVIFAFVASGAFAMEFMVGAKAGYFAWQPYLGDVDGSGFSDIDWGTGVLYGPIVSLIFTPEISLSVAGLMGRQSTSWQSVFSDYSDPNLEISGNYHFEVYRADIDSALSYRMGSNFRIFAGYKYLYLDNSISYTELRTNAVTHAIEEANCVSMEFTTYYHGPAVGVGYSHPLSQTFFTAVTVSGVYMWGSTQMDVSSRYSYTGSVFNGNVKDQLPDTAIKQIGVNIEPTIGMSPGEGLPIVTLGVRYQRFWVQFQENNPDPFPSTWLDDTLIGIFVSAVYVL